MRTSRTVHIAAASACLSIAATLGIWRYLDWLAHGAP